MVSCDRQGIKHLAGQARWESVGSVEKDERPDDQRQQLAAENEDKGHCQHPCPNHGVDGKSDAARRGSVAAPMEAALALK